VIGTTPVTLRGKDMTIHTQIEAEALRLHTALVNTLPILLDGSKSPSVKWAARQEQLATRTQINADHVEPRALAMGAICLRAVRP
jgi:hypothetical protein